MPEIPSFMKNFQQMIALRTVRNPADEKCAFLLYQKHQMLDMLKCMNHQRYNLFNSNPYESSTSNNKTVLLHQVYTVDESTM